jgi:hypothetical protein
MQYPILFKNDWNEREVFWNESTPNVSFLEIAYKLKLMGIKNHMFMLALHDPSLKVIDPHDDTLSMKWKTRVLVECTKNPWYVLREVLRAPALSGDTKKYIRANRANICLFWCFFNHVTIILVQPRQTGKSFNTDALMTTLKNFICRNTKIVLLTKDDQLRSENIDRLKKIYNTLPPYLNFKDKTDANNTTDITINALGNSYKAILSNSSETLANKAGRGITTAILHGDETPFTPNARIALNAAIPSMGAAVDEAKENGSPYGQIFTTTPGILDDDSSGQFMYEKMVAVAATWMEGFYDAKDRETLYAMIRNSSRDRSVVRVYAAFSHRQLGYPDSWVAEKISSAMQNEREANKDYLNRWGSGKSSDLIPIDIIKCLNASKMHDPLHVQHVTGYNYMLRWFINESEISQYLRSKKMVLALDTSDAIGVDSISGYGIDVETGNLIYTFIINNTNLNTFFDFMADLLIRHPNTLLIPERRSSAVALIDHLIIALHNKGIDPFTRIFNWIVNNYQDPKFIELYKEVNSVPMYKRTEEFYNKYKKHFGWATSGSGETSRSELYSTTFLTALRKCKDRIFDNIVVEQILGLTLKNNRVDHSAGKHDDFVIAFLLANWLLSKGKNLNYYGINPLSIFKENNNRDSEIIDAYSKLTDYEKYKQSKLREELSDLQLKYVNVNSTLLLNRIEEQIKSLSSQLILNKGEYYSADAVLASLRAERDGKILV